MAFCPNCNAKMDLMATECPRCGFDFPGGRRERSIRKSGWAYSSVAAFVLLMARGAAAVACLVVPIFLFEGMMRGSGQQIMLSVFAFALFAGLIVVFARASDGN